MGAFGGDAFVLWLPVNDGQDDILYDDHVESISISVSDNGDGTLDVDVTHALDGISFVNFKHMLLPVSGGNGLIMLIMILGIALVLGGVTISFISSRKARKPLKEFLDSEND